MIYAIPVCNGKNKSAAVIILAASGQAPYLTRMTIRTRKFIGAFGGTAYLIVYSLIAMAIGGAFFTNVHGLVQLGYFIVAGALWLPGMMKIIRWMSKPDETG